MRALLGRFTFLGLLAAISAGVCAESVPRPDALLMVDQHREVIVDRVVKAWPEPLTGEQSVILRNTLSGLRADRLLAISISSSVKSLVAVLDGVDKSDTAASAQKPTTKAFGDAAADLAYTPVTPCRLFDTRVSQGGLGTPTPGVRRTYGAITPVASQGNVAGCAAASGAAVALIQIGTLTPSGHGLLQGGPQGTASFPNALILYQLGDQYGTAVAMPLNLANGQFDLLEQYATADLYGDLLGYFKAPEPLNVIWVAKSGAPFTSIQAAIDFAAARASSTSPYLIKVAPGTYSERVVVPDYVQIEGSGRDSTIITSIHAAGTIFVTAFYGTELRRLSIENNMGQTTTVALYVEMGAKVRLVDVSVSTSGMYGDSATVSGNQSTVELVSSRVSATGPGNCQGILAYQLVMQNSKVLVSCNGSRNSGVLVLGGLATILGSEIVANGSSQSSVGVLASTGILTGSSSAKVQIDSSLISATTGALGSAISAMADAAADLRIRGSVLEASGGLANNSVVRNNNAQAGVAQCELRAPTAGAPLCIGNYAANLTPVTCP